MPASACRAKTPVQSNNLKTYFSASKPPSAKESLRQANEAPSQLASLDDDAPLWKRLEARLEQPARMLQQDKRVEEEQESGGSSSKCIARVLSDTRAGLDAAAEEDSDEDDIFTTRPRRSRTSAVRGCGEIQEAHRQEEGGGKGAAEYEECEVLRRRREREEEEERIMASLDETTLLARALTRNAAEERRPTKSEEARRSTGQETTSAGTGATGCVIDLTDSP